MAFYDYRNKPAAGSKPRTQSDPYVNQDGPNGSTIDYGQRGPNQRTEYENDRRRWGTSPYDNMPWSGPPGQEVGQRAPFFTPDPVKYPDYYAPENHSMDQAIADAHAANRAAYNADPAYQAAKAAGDLKGMIRAMVAAKQGAQQQRFVDQGGTAETWQNRFDPNNNWPVPHAPAPGGGRTMPPPASGTTPPTGGTTPPPPGPTPVPSSVMSTGQNEVAGTQNTPPPPPGGDTQDTNGGDTSGWRRNFKDRYLAAGGTGANFRGDIARLNPETFSYNKSLDPKMAPGDYRAATAARDQMRKEVMGIPAKFLDPSRRTASGTYR